MAEHQRAQGPHREAGAKGGQAGQQLGRVVLGREELAAKEHGEAAVEVEVIPLEERAQGRCEDHLPDAGVPHQPGDLGGMTDSLLVHSALLQEGQSWWERSEWPGPAAGVGKAFLLPATMNGDRA